MFFVRLTNHNAESASDRKAGTQTRDGNQNDEKNNFHQFSAIASMITSITNVTTTSATIPINKPLTNFIITLSKT